MKKLETEIETKKVKINIYRILTGLTEEEYYTYDHPIFSDDYESLNCTNIIIKEGISRNIINKKIVVNYASDFISEKSFLLSDGVVIKSLLTDELDWLNKSELTAFEDLKDKELEVYREMIPKLLSSVNETQHIKNKNLLI